MSLDAATQELESAIAADSSPTPLEQTPAATTPEGESNTPQVQPHHAASQPRDPSTGKFIRPDGTLSDTPEPAGADTFDGGKFNPDTLPAELQSGWKQLQADYTRKMQEVAEQRAQFEGLDPQVAREAVELYQALQNPSYLQQFHRELSTALEAQGLSPAQANVEAARQIESSQPTAPTQLSGDQLEALKADPELAPLVEHLSSMRSELDEFKSAAAAREAAEQQANWQLAIAGEIQRQEMAVLQSNPHYTDDDMEAIYELAAHYDGNLLQAQQRYEQVGQTLLARYLAQKESVGGTPTPPADGIVSEQPTPIPDLDAGLKAALGHLSEQGIDTLA
jgi:hypothetical protein